MKKKDKVILLIVLSTSLSVVSTLVASKISKHYDKKRKKD